MYVSMYLLISLDELLVECVCVCVSLDDVCAEFSLVRIEPHTHTHTGLHSLPLTFYFEPMRAHFVIVF